MKNYLVKLRLLIGEYEKSAVHVIKAKNEKEAGILALEGECHGDPDFDEFPNKDGVWDMGEMVYTIRSIRELSDQQYNVLMGEVIGF